MLGRFNYFISDNTPIVGAFTLGKVDAMSRLISNFNNEIAKAQKTIEELDIIVGNDKLSSAIVVAKALVDAVNVVSDALNGVIDQHNLYFKDDKSFQVDPVNSLVIGQEITAITDEADSGLLY